MQIYVTACPNGGRLQYGPMGAPCASDANCNLKTNEPKGGKCVVADPKGYQNAKGDAKFCCIPKSENSTGSDANTDSSTVGGTAGNSKGSAGSNNGANTDAAKSNTGKAPGTSKTNRK